jgi:MFS family permease
MDHKTDVEKLETVEKASSLQHNESIAGVDTADIDQRELKKTIRRMDLITLPVLTLLLAFCFIDRANMGLAAVAGMTADLEFVGYQYSISLLVFFPGYALFVLPSNYILAKTSVRYWLTILSICFGAFTLAIGLARNFESVVVFRVFLGIFEAG